MAHNCYIELFDGRKMKTEQIGSYLYLTVINKEPVPVLYCPICGVDSNGNGASSTALFNYFMANQKQDHKNDRT